eukprot:350831-Amorphochlora_amoeboformis.AAC.1
MPVMKLPLCRSQQFTLCGAVLFLRWSGATPPGTYCDAPHDPTWCRPWVLMFRPYPFMDALSHKLSNF